MVAAIARSIAPPLADDDAPTFLRPSQAVAFRRALAAVRLHGGALIAEPVGTGKTWIALAVACAFDAPAAVIAPATLGDQWLRAAARAGVRIAMQTHDQWSRAPRTLPEGLVILDESHRLRNPGTKRHGHLAPALVGRRALLLTATPAVNRLEDVAHQLLLAVRDDVLACDGVSSVLTALAGGRAPVALAHLIIAGTTHPPRPAVLERRLPPRRSEGRRLTPALRGIDGLALSPSPPVRALLRGVLLSALASSPAALDGALASYRHLLLQAADAIRAGRDPVRRALRRITGANPAQTVLWELLGQDPGMADLALTDLDLLPALITEVRRLKDTHDPKAERLQALLADGRRTVVFVEARATVRYLRARLGPPTRIAWCTGTGAGIGLHPLSRRQVLGWFRPGVDDPTGLGPTVLVTTDVAAEGLDLQGAERIVHYDLPWTAVRLEQRKGRAVRAGSRHAAVEVVALTPPPALERRLRRLAILLGKAPLPHRLGLGTDPDRAWRWCAATAARFAQSRAVPGTAAVCAPCAGALAAVEFLSGSRVVARLVAGRAEGHGWNASPEGVEPLLAAAAVGAPAAVDWGEAERQMRSLGGVVRRRVIAMAGNLRRPERSAPDVRAALGRLRGLAALALQRRDRIQLALAERGFAFLRRGHTAGEQRLVAELARAPVPDLPQLLARLPDTPIDTPLIVPRLVGLVLIVRSGLTLHPCPATAPYSSTSTAPCSTPSA